MKIEIKDIGDLKGWVIAGAVGGLVVVLSCACVGTIGLAIEALQERDLQNALDEIHRLRMASERRMTERAKEAQRRLDAIPKKPTPWPLAAKTPKAAEPGEKLRTPNESQKKQATRRPWNGAEP